MSAMMGSMQLIPVRTPLLKQGDDLSQVIATHSGSLAAHDIIVVSSKALATCEGASVDLAALHVSTEAQQWAARCGRTPSFCQAVREELTRLSGTALRWCRGAVLTEVKPAGMLRGSILTANAGMDESNVERGRAIGWPKDPPLRARLLRSRIEQMSGALPLAVIVSDSCCHPRRLGVTAFALAVSGIEPHHTEHGSKDLFRKPLTITVEAVADQLATAANMLMGNAGQSVPACIIRDHGIALGDYEGWVQGVEREEDLFGGE